MKGDLQSPQHIIFCTYRLQITLMTFKTKWNLPINSIQLLYSINKTIHLLWRPWRCCDDFDDDFCHYCCKPYHFNKTSKWIKVHRHRFQGRRETVNCQRLLPPSSTQWTMKYLEDNWLSGVNRCLFSLRYLPFWSCRAWRLAKHNLSGLLNSMTWRKKTPVASQLKPLWSEKSSWQALNCCNAVWPTVIPNQFLSW